jgi:DNA-directed RNA polymerase sigma subunit (sigma70/sigma32)
MDQYHSPCTPEEDRIYYRDCVILNLFFLLPYVLSPKRLRAPVFDEALQNMVLNLMVAIDRFKPERGTRFVSFIPGYLKEAIDISIRDDCVVTVPKAVRRAALKKELAQVEVTPPEEESREDILEGELPPHAYSDLDEEADTAPLWTRQVQTKGSSFDPLESEVYEQDGDSAGLETLLIRTEYLRLLEFVLSPECDILSQKERTVLIYRFGVFGAPRLTLEQVSEMFLSLGWQSTKEWIFQLQRRALGKVRGFFSNLELEELPA